MSSGKNILKYSSLVLFIFSIIQLAFALAAIMMSNVVSFATDSGIIQELFVTSSQNLAMVALEGAIGAVTGFIGLLMSRNGESFYTYQRFGTLTMVIYLVMDLIVFSMGSSIPWINFIFVVVVAIFYFWGWASYKKELSQIS